MNTEGVLGVACVDAHGLVLHTEGTVPDNCGGSIAELATRSRALVGTEGVVTAESPSGKVVISQADGATIALFMQAKA